MKFSVSIQLKRDDELSLHMQIFEAISNAITEGTLVPGTRLPSIRALAAELGVNTVTVVSAYKKLSALGYAEVRQGSGVVVRSQASRIIMSENSDLPDEIYTMEDIELMRQGRILQERDAQNIINMASTTPSLDVMSFSDIRQAVVDTLDIDGQEALAYQRSMGYEGLRQELVRRLAAEGVNVVADDVHVISGAQQGLDIVAKALLTAEDTVVVEAPTYSGALAVFKSRNSRIEAVEIQPDGMDMERLQQVMRRWRPKIIYSVPAYHNPTGYVYSVEKRLELLRLAKLYGSYIVEDDYLREMTFFGPKPPSLKSFDRDGRVILIKSFSKLLMPGLRIGFMVVPVALSGKMSLAKHTTDIFTSGLIQRSFYRYLLNGSWDKHMERIVPVFKERYVLMAEGLKRLLPYGVTYSLPEGGFSFWLRLPNNISPSALFFLANSRGLKFVPGHVFSSDRHHVNNHLRLSFAQTNTAAIDEGLSILEQCLAEITKGR